MCRVVRFEGVVVFGSVLRDFIFGFCFGGEVERGL